MSINWLIYQKLFIPSSLFAGVLSDFPVGITLNEHPIFDELSDDSLKYKFSIMDDSGTDLEVELGYFSAAERKAVIHFKADIEAGDSVFYIGFDQTAADNPLIKDIGEASSVFSNEYKGVWRMGQDPTAAAPQLIDSAGVYDGTISTPFTQGGLVNGKNGDKALQFVNEDVFFSLGTTNPNIISGMTISFFIKPSADLPEHTIFSKHAPGNLGFRVVIDEDNLVSLEVSADGTTLTTAKVGEGYNIGYLSLEQWDAIFTALSVYANSVFGYTPIAPENDPWMMVHFTMDGSYLRAYFNGAEITTGDFPKAYAGTIINGSGQDMRIGNSELSETPCYRGSIQHMSLSGAARSADWIKAETRAAYGTLLAFGDLVDNRILVGTSFKCVLTGDEDGKDDAELPCTNFQLTRNPEGKTTLQITVPDAETHGGLFTERPNGLIVISRINIYSNGTTSLSEIVRIPVTKLNSHLGSNSSSIQAYGEKTDEYLAGGQKNLVGVNYVNSTPAGNITCRLNALMLDILPGDTAIYQTYSGVPESFIVGKMNVAVSADSQQMNLTE